MGDLAFLEQRAGRPGGAIGYLSPAVAHARAAGDRHAEKLALDRAAAAQADLGDHASALGLLGQARLLAAAVGDRRHEAELFWREAVSHAELGRPELAVTAARSAVDLHRATGHPASGWYADHLARYERGVAAAAPPAGGLYLGGSIVAGAVAPPGGGRAERGPGVLRTALTAVKAMAAFVGSGFKTAPPAVYRERLVACAACAHHTGVRCRACGCVTAAKAKLLHERCPAGHWRS
jgi:hypothetical protein